MYKRISALAMLGGKQVYKRLFVVGAMIAIALFLSGCTQIDQPITEDSEGFWNSFFVYPLSF